MSDDLQPTARTTLRRHPERGTFDRATLYRILDEGLVCHVGFVDGDQPYVIPASYGRAGDRLYLHGAAGSRLMLALSSGMPACVTVTLLDGVVLARSAFNHSMNFRSAVVLGKALAVTTREEKAAAVRAIVEHVVPGRWRDVRAPTEGELDATAVVAIPLDEASAKIRTGPPLDQERDAHLATWAGVIPLELVPREPVPDPATGPERAVPEYVKAYSRPR